MLVVSTPVSGMHFMHIIMCPSVCGLDPKLHFLKG